MADPVRYLSTAKRDEAGFYLRELARGLLRDRIHLRVGAKELVVSAFEAIRMEIAAREGTEQVEMEIRLSWRKGRPLLASSGCAAPRPAQAEG